ncbi:hypothetical protein BN1723_006082 [Verticillium longisporum]|uniref:PPIase cyclophilin-type domain-containing protein n=1 Tax=Verticillium longisporum TaxID=100787 RepID=A0A0G4ND82_VERLO|nr:hypothetical protein BN1723_006082 [Verticillium longisporum]
MSVLLETSSGDIVIDLLVDYAPKLCENFLKLCKAKYYNFSPIHSIQKSFSFQTGDPLGPTSKESDGGTSIWGLLSGDSKQKTPLAARARLDDAVRSSPTTMQWLAKAQHTPKKLCRSYKGLSVD